MTRLTYSDLVNMYGPGEIVTASRPIHTASVLSVAKKDATRSASFRPLVASRSGMQKEYDGSCLHFGFVLVSAGANLNDQFFVEDDLANPDIYKTPIGEPVNQDHEQTFAAIVGEIYDAEFVDGNDERPSSILCRGVVFSDLYPHVSRKVRTGAGRWAAVSMEAMPRPLEKVGKYLVIHQPKFTGVGIVRIPANPYSKITEVDGSTPDNPVDRYDAGILGQAASLKRGIDNVLGKYVG